MFESDGTIITAVIASSLLLVFFAVVIIVAVVKYQNRIRFHQLEMDELKMNYEKEILQAQLESQEQTMASLSMELHDNIGQILSLAKLNLYSIESSETKISNTRELVSKAINDLRQISRSLNPEYLKRISLPEAIEREVQIAGNSGDFKIEFKQDIEKNPVFATPEAGIILLRMFQELLTNALKHSEASEITIRYHHTPGYIELIVEDNGKGFEKNSTRSDRLGLINLERRSDLLGASLEIDSKAGTGTKATIHFQPEETK